MERTIADLPSKDFFLKTLDAPFRMEEVDVHGNPLEKPAPERQVNNNPPAAIVATSKP